MIIPLHCLPCLSVTLTHPLGCERIRHRSPISSKNKIKIPRGVPFYIYPCAHGFLQTVMNVLRLVYMCLRSMKSGPLLSQFGWNCQYWRAEEDTPNRAGIVFLHYLELDSLPIGSESWFGIPTNMLKNKTRYTSLKQKPPGQTAYSFKLQNIGNSHKCV